MKLFLSICLAGALGTGTRYLVGLWAVSRFGTAFPHGTLIVNLAGSFMMAFVMRLALSSAVVSPDLRLILTTGFMGGLTTYSAFNYETIALLQGGATRMAFVNVGATLVGCLFAGALGIALGGRLAGA